MRSMGFRRARLHESLVFVENDSNLSVALVHCKEVEGSLLLA